jgi:hypothetical protein
MLLASNDAVTTLSLLHELFLTSPDTRLLPQSLLLERLSVSMDELKAQGYELTQSPQGYLNYWRTKGWLARTLQPGAAEEEYSLTAEAATAVRMMLTQLKPRSFATESRLASVMHQVVALAEATNTNPTTRLAALQAEKARIEQEIELLGRGEVKTLPDERALERVREVIQQTNELMDDFHNVREGFERLNQELRGRLLEADGSRASALGALFDGVDFINKSEHGRTFNAFVRLLTDAEQSHALNEALEQLLDRRFASKLSADERVVLQRLTLRLSNEAWSVHDVVRTLGHSLNRFVRNESPATNRRIHDVLQQARLSALALKDVVTPRTHVPFELTQSVPQVRSVAQYQLRDPQLSAPAAPIAQAQASTLSLDVIQDLIRQSEIDFKALRRNIREALADAESVSVQALVERFPAEQGFGTVVGYIALGIKHGASGAGQQVASWHGRDGVARSAAIPNIHFMRESLATFND